MFLRQIKQKKTGRIYLAIIDGYWDSKEQKSRNKTVESLGYLDDLEKIYDDPIAHFKAYAKTLTEEKNNKKTAVVNYNPFDRVDPDKFISKNLGYLPFSKLYHELDLQMLMQSRQRKHKKLQYNLNSILKLLVFGRLIFPSSKKKTKKLDNYFAESMDFTLDDVYNSLGIFHLYKKDIIKVINKRIDEIYKRDKSNVYYDVTNYFFFTEEEKGKKKRGVSKEHRKKPIIQMGLLMDNDGIPISYKTFKGNTLDKQTLLPALDEVKESFELERIIIVADRGINTYDNIAYNIIKKNGYVVAQSIRGGDDELKKYVLDDEGYNGSEAYKVKSRIINRVFKVTDRNGRKKNVEVPQKQVVYFSEKYQKKARHDRNKVLEKATKLVNSSNCKEKITNYGANKYIKNLHVDKKTKEVIVDAKFKPEFDREKLNEEMKYDGYYCIITSELNKTDKEIINIYRGLSEIEDCFKLTKSTLEMRPVYLSNDEHIESHFLICYIALVLLKLFKKHIKFLDYSLEESLEAIRNATYSHVNMNEYIANTHGEVLHNIGKVFDIPYDRRGLSLKEIKQLAAKVKK